MITKQQSAHGKERDDFRVRKAGMKDFEAVFELLCSLWEGRALDKAAIRKTFVNSLKDRNYSAFVSVEEGEITGFAGTQIHNMLWQAGKMCRLNELVVVEKLRGTGTGSSLLTAVERHAQAKGCKGVDLETAVHRKRTHKFYEKRNYMNRAFYYCKIFKA